MFKSISIKAKLLTIVISSIMVVSVVMLTQSVFSLKSTSEIIIKQFEDDAYHTKEVELKNYISLAMKTIESYYDRTSKEKVKHEVESKLKEQTGFIFSIIQGEYDKYNGIMPDDELQELLKSIVKNTRYGNSGYFWINDTNAKMIMHPLKPSLDGKDLSNLEDKAGKKLFYEFAQVAKRQGEGLVDYLWSKPNVSGIHPKISFVKLFKPYNWVIGTGEYVENVTAKLQKEALEAISNMKYGKDGYYWVNNSEPTMLMHPYKTALIGKSLKNTTDANGKTYFVEMVKVSQNSKDGGLVKYTWKDSKSDLKRNKFSYVKEFKQWGWIVGTGAYVDDITKRVLAMQEQTQKDIKDTIITNIIIIFIIMIILAFVMAFISNKVIFKPLMTFQDGLLNFF